jgi:hypothetical protein
MISLTQIIFFKNILKIMRTFQIGYWIQKNLIYNEEKGASFHAAHIVCLYGEYMQKPNG